MNPGGRVISHHRFVASWIGLVVVAVVSLAACSGGGGDSAKPALTGDEVVVRPDPAPLNVRPTIEFPGFVPPEVPVVIEPVETPLAT